MPRLSPAELKDLHAKSSRHRPAIEASTWVGCFRCETIFSPLLIADWSMGTQRGRESALCPNCGIDAVLPEHGLGKALSLELLCQMHEHWFKDNEGSA